MSDIIKAIEPISGERWEKDLTGIFGNAAKFRKEGDIFLVETVLESGVIKGPVSVTLSLKFLENIPENLTGYVEDFDGFYQAKSFLVSGRDFVNDFPDVYFAPRTEVKSFKNLFNSSANLALSWEEVELYADDRESLDPVYVHKLLARGTFAVENQTTNDCSIVARVFTQVDDVFILLHERGHLLGGEKNTLDLDSYSVILANLKQRILEHGLEGLYVTEEEKKAYAKVMSAEVEADKSALSFVFDMRAKGSDIFPAENEKLDGLSKIIVDQLCGNNELHEIIYGKPLTMAEVESITGMKI